MTTSTIQWSRLAIIAATLFSFGCNNSATTKEEPISNPLFSSLSPSETGIDFINEVKDQEDFNLLTYRNFYNGGGVSIGDINNDNLPDIYFSANMKPNQLYLNKGDWKFENITEKAGVSGTKAWSTGITMADINGDGLMDIYVCNSGDIKGSNKENELFINQGDLTFKEEAAAYGLNNEGFSTHASFFDYDLDGDLDCYILNNSFKDPDRIDQYKTTRDEIDDLGGDKLYRNNGPDANGQITFSDVTQEAGIYSSLIGFGLGVSVGDLNGDIYPDIYISNDFWERDYLYLNQGNGTFSEELTERISLTSVSSMGADLADINNDSHLEIFSTDMLAGDNYRLKAMTMFDPYRLENLKYSASYHYQILQNCLQLNDGNAHFQEIASLAEVSATDWSWGALIFDFENDGWKDIYVSNGIYHDIMYLDFTTFISDKANIQKIVSEKGRFDFRDFLPYLPSNSLSNFAFTNNRDLTFDSKAKELGLDTPSFSNGAAYADIDLDGDLDLIVNNVNMPAFVYQNQSDKQNSNNYLTCTFKGKSPNTQGIGAEVRVKANEFFQVLQNYTSRGFESSTVPVLNFGLGNAKKADSVWVIWPDQSMEILTNVEANQTLNLAYENAKRTYKSVRKKQPPLFKESTTKAKLADLKHKENHYNDFDHERLLPHMFSTEGPKILKGDVNGDKLEDFLILGATNDIDKLFLQNKNGQFDYSSQSAFLQDSAFEGTAGAFFDSDNDGDLDLLLGAGGNEYQKGIEGFLLRYYENDGKGNFTKAKEKTPPGGGHVSVILPTDYDKDGDQDVFIGGRTVPGNYGLLPTSFLFRNDGNGTWTNITPPFLAGAGMVTDGVWADIDSDGNKDLVLVGEWMPITVYKNNGKALGQGLAIPNSYGWWNTIETADLDNDGDQDFVLGNWGENSKFKASPEKPLSMFVKDFDNNGKSEFIINWYPPLDDKSYPFASKMDITAQIPGLKRSNLKYEDYANKTYEALFSKQQREGAMSFKADFLKNAVLINTDNNFELIALPKEAQVSPVYSIIADDLDGNNTIDLLLFGNLYDLKPEVGRYDANFGILLKGDGKGSFKSVSSSQSGIFVEGQVRDAAIIDMPGKPKTFIIGRNNDHVLLYQQNKDAIPQL